MRVVAQQQQQIQQQQADLARAQTQGQERRQDPLKLGKPSVFSGDESHYEDWIFKLKVLVGMENLDMLRGMEAMEVAADVQ
eukprot:5120428-Amphidinium_carterae.1